MKFILIKSIFFLLILFLNNAYAKNFNVEYMVSTSGIKIGKFIWSLKINEKNYITEIFLRNSGIFSPIYKFNGKYKSQGVVEKDMFVVREYKQYWETKKKIKTVEMSFDKYLTNLSQQPEEKEFSRVELNDLYEYSDPLTSFLNILLGNDNVKTIDGRRIYIMKKTFDNKLDTVTIKIKDYKNIWADHKRNDLKKIEFILQEGFLPKKINIYFKDSVFKLKKT